MKATELRIGNYVNYCNSERQLDGELFLQLLKYTTQFEPIPLTEEWLSKFELEHVEVRGRWIKDKFVIWKQRYLDPLSIFEQNKFYLQVVDFQGDIFTLHLEIQYVHQLQNLYFALTGEELTLKPHTDDCK